MPSTGVLQGFAQGSKELPEKKAQSMGNGIMVFSDKSLVIEGQEQTFG